MTVRARSPSRALHVRPRFWLAAVLVAVLFATGLVMQKSRTVQVRLIMWQHGLAAGTIASGHAGEAPELASFGLPSAGTYRLASLSKPITAAAVLNLVRTGRMSLNDKVGNSTVMQLLQHSGGWDRVIAGDPFCSEDESLPTQFAPGTRFAYSNLGYCLLSREIERRSGVSYEEYARSVLPRGSALRIGIPELAGAGGWVGTTSDYYAFASVQMDPLQTAKPSYAVPGEPYYDLRWRVWPDGVRSHFGYLPGSFSFVFRQGSKLIVGVFAGSPDNPEALAGEFKRILIDQHAPGLQAHSYSSGKPQ